MTDQKKPKVVLHKYASKITIGGKRTVLAGSTFTPYQWEEDLWFLWNGTLVSYSR